MTFDRDDDLLQGILAVGPHEGSDDEDDEPDRQ
jgi:hypothetical protein